jgi:hypothetical protein
MATKNTATRDAQVTNLSGLFNRLDLIESAGPTVLVTFTLSWGTASTGTISVTGTPLSETAANTGTADDATLYHSTNTEEITGLTVGTSGTDITMNTTDIESGKTVELNSFSLTEPAATA